MSDLLRSRVTYDQTTSTSVDGVVTFNLRLVFEPKEGDLPDGVSGVFVKEVIVPSDPKQDRFKRIATLADLGRTATSRERALDGARYRPAGAPYITSRSPGPSMLYLSGALTLQFDNLQVAIQAKATIEQRIDALIADWQSFRDSYVTVTQTEFPLADAAIVAAAKQNFYDKVAAYVVALDAKKTATAALSSAQQTLAVKSLEKARVDSLKELVCTNTPRFTTYASAYAQYFSGSNGRKKLRDVLALAKSYHPAAVSDTTYDSVAAAIEAALSIELAAYADLEASQTNNYVVGADKMFEACNILDAQLLAARKDATDAATAVSATTTTLATATAAADKARVDKNTALAALIAVCPAYDPKTDDGLPSMGEWESVILG